MEKVSSAINSLIKVSCDNKTTFAKLIIFRTQYSVLLVLFVTYVSRTQVLFDLHTEYRHTYPQFGGHVGLILTFNVISSEHDANIAPVGSHLIALTSFCKIGKQRKWQK